MSLTFKTLHLLLALRLQRKKVRVMQAMVVAVVLMLVLPVMREAMQEVMAAVMVVVTERSLPSNARSDHSSNGRKGRRYQFISHS